VLSIRCRKRRAQHVVETTYVYGYYNGGARIVDVSGEFEAIFIERDARLANSGWETGRRHPSSFTWAPNLTRDGLFYDVNPVFGSEAGDPIHKGSTTMPDSRTERPGAEEEQEAQTIQAARFCSTAQSRS